MSSKVKNIILVFQSVLIIIMLLYILIGTTEGKALLGESKKELTLEEKYEKIKGKNIEEMTPEEWTVSNLYHLKEVKNEGAELDTMSYEEALERNRRFREEMKRELDPCTEEKLINAFHEIMEFNMPNDRYKKDEIKWKEMGNCVLHINVYTKEPSYGWRTFWVFEVRYLESTGQYELQAIKKEFLG